MKKINLSVILVLTFAIMANAFAGEREIVAGSVSIETRTAEDGSQLFAATVIKKNKKEATQEAKGEAQRACIQQTLDPSRCSVIHQDAVIVEVSEVKQRLCGLVCFMTGEFIDESTHFVEVKKKLVKAIVIVKSK